MTDTIRAIGDRLLDGADLVIDFATLGEYGLEPVGAGECRPEPCAAGRPHGPVRFREAVERFERPAA